jgi:class 3 adenylate cyclase
MGCGASALQPQSASLTELLRTVASKVEEDPSRLRGDASDLLRRIARSGHQSLASHNPSFVQETWDRAVELRGVKPLGLAILGELCRIQPHAEVVFATVSKERQGIAVGRMIDQVVRVETSGASLVPVLLSLGARHASYGFPPSMLRDVQLAAMKVLHEVLNGLSDEETDAWQKVWATVIDLMTHGMNSPGGVTNREKYELQNWQHARALWQRVRLQQAEGPEERRLFTRFMYKQIIHHRPDFRRFSNLTDFRTADRVMHLLTHVVECNATDRDCTAMLRECGARHLAYDVSVEDMWAFEPPFLATCEAYLTPDFTKVDRHIMSRVWAFVVEAMASGMTDTIAKEAQRAPQTDALAIVFTDIEKSTRLWEANPSAMAAALEKHNRILRQLIQQYNGYEVKTIGDSFMVAFDNMVDATLFSCGIQTELMIHAPSAPGFRMVRPTQGGGPSDQWNDSTLRVRVGVEWCTQITAVYDTVHRRFDYFGPSVNIAARVESHAAGGQVLMTGGALEELRRTAQDSNRVAPADFLSLQTTASSAAKRPSVNDAIVVAQAAAGASLKGVAQTVDVYSVAPLCLSRRAFNAAKQQETESGTVASTSHLRAPSTRGGVSQTSDSGPAIRTTVG